MKFTKLTKFYSSVTKTIVWKALNSVMGKETHAEDLSIIDQAIPFNVE